MHVSRVCVAARDAGRKAGLPPSRLRRYGSPGRSSALTRASGGGKSLAAIIVFSMMIVACGGTTAPAPPVIDTPAGTLTINGTERLGWDQRAADVVELATISYALYVDGTRGVLTGAACEQAIGAAGFACSARLPALSPGSHSLELASFVTDGSLLESPRSGALRVTVVPGQ